MRERHSGAQHGRIAVLKPDKWCSYMEYHLKLVSEGLLEGDRWHLISVQENLLFSYLEEPRTRKYPSPTRCTKRRAARMARC